MLSSVPLRIVAGTTVELRRSLPGYSPADGWDYKLYLVGPSEHEAAGVEDGDGFLVTLSAEDSAALSAGTYSYAERVEHGDGRVFQVGFGTLQVLANLATADAGDQRSHARRTLEAIEAVIEKRATSDQESYQIQGRAIVRIPIGELLKFRQLYREEVRNEEAAQNLAAGLDDPRRVGIRFRHA